jgi:hypothetical protein
MLFVTMIDDEMSGLGKLTIGMAGAGKGKFI